MKTSFGFDSPPADVNPQSIRAYLKEQYNFDDIDMTYSNLWAQQINSGNSWDNFFRYFERMGLRPFTPAPVVAVTQEPAVSVATVSVATGEKEPVVLEPEVFIAQKPEPVKKNPLPIIAIIGAGLLLLS